MYNFYLLHMNYVNVNVINLEEVKMSIFTRVNIVQYIFLEKYAIKEEEKKIKKNWEKWRMEL